jgi:ribosome biogenesis GTPase A
MRIRYSFSSRHTGTLDVTNLHKKPVPSIVKEVIRISDIVLEVLDARFIEQTRNKELEQMILGMGKKIVFLINKADLIDVQALKDSGKLEDLKPYVLFSCKTKMGRGDLRTRIKIEAKKEKQDKRTHVGIIGYPNTGKSSIINLLTGRRAAGTAAAAGFTKGIQKVRLVKGVLLLDTPGVMPEKEAPAHRAAHAKKLSI